jgi:hypothetical protein
LYWISGNPGLHPKKSIPLLIFLLAEVQRKIFLKNFSFGGKEGLVTLGFSPNIPLQESLVAYKIPSFASAKTSARATPSRTFDLIRKIFSHVFLLNLRATCLCGPFRWSEINLLPGVGHLLIRRNLVDGVLYRLRVESLSTPFQLRLGRILAPNLKARDAIHVDFSKAFPLPEGIGESPCRQ